VTLTLIEFQRNAQGHVAPDLVMRLGRASRIFHNNNQISHDINLIELQDMMS
jgi:hypothetical protein